MAHGIALNACKKAFKDFTWEADSSGYTYGRRLNAAGVIVITVSQYKRVFEAIMYASDTPQNNCVAARKANRVAQGIDGNTWASQRGSTAGCLDALKANIAKAKAALAAF